MCRVLMNNCVSSSKMWFWNLGSLNPFSNTFPRHDWPLCPNRNTAPSRHSELQTSTVLVLQLLMKTQKPCFLLWPFFDQLINLNFFLTFICPCIANIVTVYNQQDATFHNLFRSVKRSTSFRPFFRPSSGSQNCTYSVRYLSE